jgi:hypothetical protein
MVTRNPLVALLSLLAVGLITCLRADEKDASSPKLGMIAAFAGAGDTSFGHCNGAVVFEKNRAVGCFGLKKSPKEKEKYLYIILFKNDPGERAGDGVAAQALAGNTFNKTDVRITRGGKIIETAYRCSLDEKTQAVKDEVLKVGGTEVKDGDARVFLVDLAREKIAPRSVKVDLPDEIPTLHDKLPDLDSKEGKAWAATMLQAVEQLKKKSPEVKKFLDP